MDIYKIILILYIISFTAVVIGVMWFVRKAKLDQKKRQQTIVRLAKEKDELSQVNDLKDELLTEKNKLIDKYREYVGKL